MLRSFVLCWLRQDAKIKISFFKLHLTYLYAIICNRYEKKRNKTNKHDENENKYFFLKDATYPGVNENIRRQIGSLVVYHFFFFTDVVTNRLTYPLTLILLICKVSIT